MIQQMGRPVLVRKDKPKLYKKERRVFIVVSVIFFVYAFTLIYPFFYALNNSFKTNWDFIENIWNFPKNPTFENYVYAFTEYDILTMFLNTMILTVGGTVISLVSSSVMAYVLSKYKFRGSSFIYTLAIIFMLIPNLGNVSATYKLLIDLKLIGNILGVLILYAGPFGMNFLLLYSFFKGISWNYAEAAKIDGAGNFRVFFRIMLPQARAGLITVGFMTAIGHWNDYFTPYMYLPDTQTLATGLQRLANSATLRGEYTQMFAAMIIVTLPIIIVFAFAQETIINNTIAGGLKG